MTQLIGFVAFLPFILSFSLTRELPGELGGSSPLGLTAFSHPRQIRARRKKMETGITGFKLLLFSSSFPKPEYGIEAGMRSSSVPVLDGKSKGKGWLTILIRSQSSVELEPAKLECN